MTKITVKKVAGRTDLYRKYPQQCEAQDCYVELDCRQEVLSADYNAEIGNGVPMSVWHGNDQRWGIACLNADAANRLLDEITPLAERVCAGYTCEWDGSNNVASFDTDATAAIEDIAELCRLTDESYAEDRCIVYTAREWFGQEPDAYTVKALGIKLDSTNEEISKIASLTLEDALDEGLADDIEGIEEYLLELRDDLAATKD